MSARGGGPRAKICDCEIKDASADEGCERDRNYVRGMKIMSAG